MVVDICITAYILTEKGDVFMNAREKLLRLLNQQWNYNSTNKTFISKFARLYGDMPDLIYIRNGRARYGEILEKLFRRNKCKTISTNFNWSRQLNMVCHFPYVTVGEHRIDSYYGVQKDNFYKFGPIDLMRADVL